MDILGIAAQGMDQAQGQFEKTARRIAQPSPTDSVSLSDDMVALLQSKHDFEANLNTAKVAGDLWKSTLNLLA